MESLADPEIWIALATLTALELVLGIDNIIFISILAGKLPPDQRDKARKTGILLAAITRLALLFTIAWIISLTAPLFDLFGQTFSWRDLILIAGGLFLIAKATHEIHQKLEGDTEAVRQSSAATFGSVIVQIMLLDIVFSLDSIITAVGMVDERWVMATAILISIGFMIGLRETHQRFRRPPPDHQGIGAELPVDDRPGADLGRVRRARPEGLRLHGHGVLGVRGGDQPVDPQAQRQVGAGEAAREVRRRAIRHGPSSRRDLKLPARD